MPMPQNPGRRMSADEITEAREDAANYRAKALSAGDPDEMERLIQLAKGREADADRGYGG